MVRATISISIGQAGIQMSQPVWKQYCTEHGIGYDGTTYNRWYWAKQGPTKLRCSDISTVFQSYFEETAAGHYVPRSLMVDLESNVIDDVKTSNIKKLFRSDLLLSGQEDAANNFARGHYTVGAEMIDKVNDRLRKIADNCDNS
eukprot:372402_1